MRSNTFQLGDLVYVMPIGFAVDDPATQLLPPDAIKLGTVIDRYAGVGFSRPAYLVLVDNDEKMIFQNEMMST